MGPNALNNAGLLHGGIVAALLDVASYLRLLPELADGEKLPYKFIASEVLLREVEGLVPVMGVQVQVLSPAFDSTRVYVEKA